MKRVKQSAAEPQKKWTTKREKWQVEPEKKQVKGHGIGRVLNLVHWNTNKAIERALPIKSSHICTCSYLLLPLTEVTAVLAYIRHEAVISSLASLVNSFAWACPTGYVHISDALIHRLYCESGVCSLLRVHVPVLNLVSA